MSICENVHMTIGAHGVQKRALEPLESGVRVEPPNMGAGNCIH